jgi:hypothetical protein
MNIKKEKKAQALGSMKTLGAQIPEVQISSEMPSITPVDMKPSQKRINTPCRIPEKARDQLRELAFYNRPKSGNEFMIEGLDMMFKHYGLKTIAEIEKEACEHDS